MKYTHITYSERRRIERLVNSKTSKNQIAKQLGRSPKAIRYEIKKNTVKGEYIASKAEHKSKQKRKKAKLQCMKVAMDKKLKKYVIENIKDDQSPEGIAGRIKKVDTHIQKVSTKAIYKFIFSPHGRKIEKHLHSKAVNKKRGRKRGSNKPALDGRTMIDKRPTKVEKRLEFGHYEGDFVESGRDGKGSFLVIIERKTRQPFIRYTEDKKTKHINNLIAKTLRDCPVKSITLDNDVSFQKHKELSELIESSIFFCHPYCSHEKGTVENRNKAIRRYAKKGCDLSKLKPEFIKEIETTLRNKYMKCLDYKTPQEAWNIEINKFRKRQISAIIQTTKKRTENVRNY